MAHKLNSSYPTDPRFGCGPSLIPVEFVEKLAKTGPYFLGTSHRSSSVKNVVKEIQEGLRKYFELPDGYEIVLGNGGATLLFDMIGLGLVEKKILHYTCGEFSHKWFLSSKAIPWIEAIEKKFDFGEGVSYSQENDDFDVCCLTLNETSTGVQLSEIPELDREKTLLAIDATSGAGQVSFDVKNADLFFFSPQKVFASEGGLFVCIMSPRAKKRAIDIAKNKDRYIPGIMNWETAIDNSEKNQTYNTPSLSTLFFLNEQIKRMNDLGYSKVVEEAERKYNLMKNWVESKDYLSFYVKEECFRSRAVATIDVDESVNVQSILKKLSDDKIVFGIESYRKLGRNQFRIALFHNITYEDLEKLTILLSDFIENQR